MQENIDFVIRFQDEGIKNELGNTLRNLLNEINLDRPDARFCEQYEEVELKYKVAKVLESRRAGDSKLSISRSSGTSSTTASS